MPVQAVSIPKVPGETLDWDAGRVADRDTAYSVEQHLFEEAAMLDERRYGEWFATLDDALRYYVPTRYAVSHRDLKREIGGPQEAAHFDDTKASIKVRIKRLDTNMAWAESPASRVRRIVTNVSVRRFDGQEDVMARSSLLLLKYRHDRDLETLSAARYDRLRRSDMGWWLVSRVGLVDQTVILTSNLSFFI